MKFKYDDDFKQLRETCPPVEYLPSEMEVYRWVYEDIMHQDNFVSQYYKKPKRFISKSDIEKCKAMALSMFDSLENAKKRFHTILNINGSEVYQTLGSHIAKGFIQLSDGVNSHIENNGHLSHHPSYEADYKNSFVIIEKL